MIIPTAIGKLTKSSAKRQSKNADISAALMATVVPTIATAAAQDGGIIMRWMRTKMKKIKDDFNFDWLFKVVPIFIIAVFVLIVASWVLFGTIAFKTYDSVKEHGLKSVIERIWEGEK
jgi:hypothetical protein